MLFGCPRQNVIHSSENLKVIYIERSMFYAINNYQFKTSEGKQFKPLKSYGLGMCIFLQCEIIFLVSGP